jgi:hypothetical protein
VVNGAELDGRVVLPDLRVGRLVETPQEIVKTIATYISQDGILDLTQLHPTTGKKVLVTGYDFLSGGASEIATRWKDKVGASTVDAALIGGDWNIATIAARKAALESKIAARYGVMAIAGHATHYAEGVPGTHPQDIQGLEASDLYDPSVDLAGSIVYAAGCHGGLSLPGSAAADANHSLDLPQTMLSRGVVAYVANSGYGWGLRYGIGYAARLMQIFTEEMTVGETNVVGNVVKRSKERYTQETARADAYDEKTVMQWTVYGLPMYVVKTATASAKSPGVQPHAVGEEMLGAVRVKKEIAEPSVRTNAAGPTTTALPQYLLQLNLSFDFTGANVFKKHGSNGAVLPAGSGCPDAIGCYYSLNGLYDRGTGSADLPIEPYLVYDSKLSGTSQHGVLWKGGTYDQESNWKPVFAELMSNGGDGSNHGVAPRVVKTKPTSPRVVLGPDPPDCRPGDEELNSLTLTVGETVKEGLEYSIARRYRNTDLEVFYYNNTGTPASNCDRTGPELQGGPFSGRYDSVSGTTVSWAVPAVDAQSAVWRVVVVYNRNSVDGQGRGTWIPVELTDNGAGTFTGSVNLGGPTQLTYVIQAVDTRGNVTWLDYVSAETPSSGVDLGVAMAVDQLVGIAVDPPMGVTATATSATAVHVTWTASIGASGYDVYRSASGTSYAKVGSTTGTAYNDTASSNIAYLYAVKAIGSGGESAYSAPDLATTVMFTDAPLVGGTTPVRRTHFVELRTAVNAVRALAGLGAYGFADATLTAGSTPIRVAHITDLRMALDAARAQLPLTALSYTDPVLSTGGSIKAVHVTELRNGVK